MKEIQLNNGRKALVSDDDFELVSGYHWYCDTDGYASAYAGGGRKYAHHVTMHRLILGARPGQFVDHKDGDRLNNTRENIRFASNAENQRNKDPKSLRHISGFKGVQRNGHKWQAIIKKLGKRFCLGSFEKAEDAARAYDEKARELFGEFARTNF